ncbi:MAG: cupin domain-containing protein [Candidatus Zipacnadales bacterium]
MTEPPSESGIGTTVVHTDEVPRDQFEWGTTAWCLGLEAGNSCTLTFGRVVIEPGRSNPPHGHYTCDEILYVLSGEIVHYADDMEPVRMTPRDLISIPAGIFHHATCVSQEPAEMIVVYSAPARDIEFR